MHDEVTSVEKRPARRLQWRRLAIWGAIGVLIGVILCFRIQADALAAVTAIPAWCWVIACLPLALLGWRDVRRWEQVAYSLVLVFACVFTIAETLSLTRWMWSFLGLESSARDKNSLRVVTLNCEVGSQRAAQEVRAFGPDIVLLQESPREAMVRELAKELFGDQASVAWSPDCSILAKGELRDTLTDHSHFTKATLVLPDGREIEVVSIRLAPPVVRFDLWNPKCWQQHATNRRRHRDQVSTLMSAMARVPTNRPVVIGGDWNAPAGDGALAELRPRFCDAFDSAGRAWGNTVLNRLPVMRFDQIWCNHCLTPIAISAAKTVHSDHRLVVGDFLITTPTAPASP